MVNIGKDVRQLVMGLLAGTHTALPARIRTFDDAEMRAEVELLRVDESGNAPVIVECPVMIMRANNIAVVPPYQQDDIVLVVFAESDLEGPLHDGEPRDPKLNRSHSLDDAMVVGGLTAAQESISVGGSADNWRIGDENGTGYMEITNGGTIRVHFPTIEIGEQSLEKLVKKSGADVFNNHTHPGDSGGTTGSPNQTISAGDLTDVTVAN